MTIGVNGQYLMSFGLNALEDFLEPNDFVSFVLEETAGNVLPTFKMQFICDSNVLQQVNEQADFRVQLGHDRDSMISTSLYITEVTSSRYGDRRNVTIQGMSAQPGYINNTRTGVTSPKSGVEVVQSVASRYFRWDSNIGKSSDIQNWVQHNIPDKQFLQDAWMRSFVPGSWLATGISAVNNTFVLRDMARHAASGAQWNFVPDDATGGNEITYTGDYGVRNTSGFINSWVGYATQQPVFNIDQGLQDLIQGVASNLFSAASGLMQRGLAGGIDALRKGAFAAKTGNMHDQYHQALQNNMVNNALASSFIVNLNFVRVFRPVRVLDTAYFVEDAGRGAGASEYASGNYTIAKVTRIFTASQHGTQVELNREGPGGR